MMHIQSNINIFLCQQIMVDKWVKNGDENKKAPFLGTF